MNVIERLKDLRKIYFEVLKTPTEDQLSYLTSKEQIRVITWPRRSGKTTAIISDIKTKFTSSKKYTAAYIAQNIGMQKLVIRELANSHNEFRYVPSQNIIINEDESKILWLSFANDYAERGGHRGKKIDEIYFDETHPTKKLFDELLYMNQDIKMTICESQIYNRQLSDILIEAESMHMPIAQIISENRYQFSRW